MQSKTSTFLKVLINRFHPGVNQSYLKCLPQDEVKDALNEVTFSQETSVALSWPNDLILKTHYSWLAPLIDQLPKSLKSLTLNALTEEQSKGIKKLLKIDSALVPLSPKIKNFLLGRLYQQWAPVEGIPSEYLPTSNLEELFKLTKLELVDLINLLAMFDLSEAIRHIVDKKNLKALYLCLTPQKQRFLRVCLHKKEKLAAPKLDINKWDGSQNHLNAILHRRGLLRLGKALCGQTPQFFWNLMHTLDTGRGNALAEYYKEDQIPGITPLLVQQVITVINFIKPKSEV